MQSYKTVKTRLLKDKAVQKEYEALGPEFAAVELMVRSGTDVDTESPFIYA